MVRRKKTTGIPHRSPKGKKGGFLLAVAVLAVIMLVGFLFASYRNPAAEKRSFSEIVTEIIPKTPDSVKSGSIVDDLKEKTKPKQSATIDNKAAKPRAAHKKLTGSLAVVVDDCGYDLEPVETMSGLPIDMTFSIIPFKTNSMAALAVIKNNGKIPMLHLPMEPMDANQASETRMVRVSMTKEQVQNYTREAINSLPGVLGVNNHQGSRATSNTATMRAVLEVLQSNNLFFVDSRTIAASVGYKLAREMGVNTGYNSRFLDNSSDADEIKKQIWAAADLADQYGSLIVICHARPNTAKAWVECYKEIQAAGINFVPVSTLLI
jgi:uncharacterized protein